VTFFLPFGLRLFFYTAENKRNNININPTTDCRTTAPSQLQHKNFMSSIHHRDAVKLALRHAAISTFLGIR
jgi:hypothetical protein